MEKLCSFFARSFRNVIAIASVAAIFLRFRGERCRNERSGDRSSLLNERLSGEDSRIAFLMPLPLRDSTRALRAIYVFRAASHSRARVFFARYIRLTVYVVQRWMEQRRNTLPILARGVPRFHAFITRHRILMDPIDENRLYDVFCFACRDNTLLFRGETNANDSRVLVKVYNDATRRIHVPIDRFSS